MCELVMSNFLLLICTVLAHDIEEDNGMNYILNLSYNTFRKTSAVMKSIPHCCVIHYSKLKCY